MKGDMQLQAITTWCGNNWRPILSEFMATASLILFGCMSFCRHKEQETSVLLIPLAFGLIVTMNLQIFAHISGGHMNPAISLGAAIFGSISVPLMIGYIIAQCVGAVAGFGLLQIITPDELKPRDMCSSLPREDLDTVHVICIEMLLTAALNLVCCGIWDSRNKNKHDSAPIRFGLIVTGLAIIGGNLTGCSMNPARSLGPAVWNNTWDYHWVYWVGPLVGGGVSSTFYTLIWKPKSDIMIGEN